MDCNCWECEHKRELWLNKFEKLWELTIFGSGI
jgi:hypothetical protein